MSIQERSTLVNPFISHKTEHNRRKLEFCQFFIPDHFHIDKQASFRIKLFHICNVERVKESYDHVDSMYEHRPPKHAPGKYLVFKRWDTLEEQDHPQVVFFFGNPNVIAGLHGLANFDMMTPYGVIAPFGTGCDSIVGFPMHELESDQPKAVLGALDPLTFGIARKLDIGSV